MEMTRSEDLLVKKLLSGLLSATASRARKDWDEISGSNPYAKRLRHNRRVAAARRYLQGRWYKDWMADASCILWAVLKERHPERCKESSSSPLLDEWAGSIRRNPSDGVAAILAAAYAAVRLEAELDGIPVFDGVFVDEYSEMDGLDRLARIWQATESRRARRELAAAGYSCVDDPSPREVDPSHLGRICLTLAGMWVEDD